MAASRRVISELPRDPSAAVPVAAAFVFAEGEPFARPPMPIVFMNDDTGFMGKLVCLMRMPTRVALAYDRRGCAVGGRHEHTCADCGSGKDFSEHLNLSPLPFAPRANTLGGSRFRDDATICEIWSERL